LDGGIIDLDWFNRYRVLPSPSVWRSVLQFWDTAQKPDEINNAPWAGGTWIETIDGRLYLADVLVKWMNYPVGKRTVKNYGLKWNPHGIVLEDKSTGSSLLQELPEEYEVEGRGNRFTIPVLGMDPSGEGDKIIRMSVETPAIEAGQVFLPEEAEWLLDFEKEVSTFPNSKLKDQVDMLSMSLKYFREKRGDFWDVMEQALGGKKR
jgi:predicted phage terminase large subunit-like protein